MLPWAPPVEPLGHNQKFQDLSPKGKRVGVKLPRALIVPGCAAQTRKLGGEERGSSRGRWGPGYPTPGSRDDINTSIIENYLLGQ
jgi:hypothetical protein